MSKVSKKEIKKQLKEAEILEKIADKKKKALKIIKEVENDPDVILNQDDEEKEEVDIELEDFIKNYTEAGAKVRVSRWDDENNTWAVVGQYALKDFENSVDKVARTYGGGTYKFEIRDAKGQYVKSFTQTFDEIAYPRKNNNDVVYPVGYSDTPNIIEIIKEMREQNKDQQTQMMAMMTAFMNSLGTMIGQRKNLLDTTEDLVNLKKLFQADKNENPLNSINNLLAILKTGVELGSQLNTGSNDNGENIFETMLKKMIMTAPADKLLNSITELTKSQVGNTQTPQIEHKEKEVSMPKNIQENVITTLARVNIDPDKIAKTFVENLDNFTFSLIVNLQNNIEDLKKIVYEMIPDLRNYPDWTQRFINSVIKYVNIELNAEEKIENKEEKI